MADLNDRNVSSPSGGTDETSTGNARDYFADWNREEQWWRDNYQSRPYATADRDFEHYRGGYRYGVESAARHAGKRWEDVEHDVRAGWDRFEQRGSSTWDDVKDAVRDAWDRVTGKSDHAPR